MSEGAWEKQWADVSDLDMQVVKFIGLKGGETRIGWCEERSPSTMQAR